jgi:hypothetical protein
MAEAKGIHTHATKKLGRRPALDRAAVDAGAFLRVQQLPDHPLVDPIPLLTYPMDRNDEAGDCVVAGLDHALQTIYAALGVPRQNWTDAQLLAYYQTQNPGFRSWADGGGPDDGGMVIQTFLEHLIHAGQISAFGKLDPANEELMKAATWVGLAIVTGEDLRKAQQKQSTWDYVAGSPEWGGHCTTTVGYSNSPDTQACVSWGEVVPMTESFVEHQVDEAWFVLTPAHIQNPVFRNNFDLQGFANAVAQLTGGKIIVPVPPPVPPVKPPAPPVPPVLPEVLADFPFGALDTWAKKPTSTKQAPPAARKYLDWKHAHGLQ